MTAVKTKQNQRNKNKTQANRFSNRIALQDILKVVLQAEITPNLSPDLQKVIKSPRNGHYLGNTGNWFLKFIKNM